MPVIGVLLGLALASKWVALYAIGGDRPADPRPERARPRPGHPRADRAHLRARLHGDHRAAGQRHREPHVPARDDGPDPHRGRGRGAPSRRLDRRRDALRGRRPDRPRDPRLLRGARPGRARRRGRGRGRSPPRRSGSRCCSCCPRSRSTSSFALAGRLGFGPLAAPPGPDDPARRLEPPAPPAEGWLRPGLGARHPGRLGGDLPGGRAARRSTSSRTSRGRWSRATGSSPAGRRATPARRCST